MSDHTDRTMNDANSVLVTGIVRNPRVYRVKEQLRFEFMVRTGAQSGRFHSIPVQLHGQSAHDGLMQYQAGREVNINGYLKEVSTGVIVVGESVFWGRARRSMGVEDLEAKLELLKSVDQRELVQSLDTESSGDDGAAGDTQDEVEERSPNADEEAPAVFGVNQDPIPDEVVVSGNDDIIDDITDEDMVRIQAAHDLVYKPSGDHDGGFLEEATRFEMEVFSLPDERIARAVAVDHLEHEPDYKERVKAYGKNVAKTTPPASFEGDCQYGDLS